MHREIFLQTDVYENGGHTACRLGEGDEKRTSGRRRMTGQNKKNFLNLSFLTYHFPSTASHQTERGQAPIPSAYGGATGQAIVLVALTILVMCLFAFMTINTGVVFYRRIQMQNAADCAALSAARTTARTLNTIANANNVIGIPDIYCVGGFLPPIVWGKRIGMMKSMRGAYEALRSLETAWVTAGAGQSAAMGYQVAKLNGAKAGIPTGSFSMKLKGRKISVYYYSRCIKIPTPWGPIPIPIPDLDNFPKRYNPAYYRRRWETDVQKAQPPHKTKWRVYKDAYQPFGGALFGKLSKSKQTWASAQAQVYYDCKKSYFLHYGGFPRSSRASFMEKMFIPQPLSPANPAQFNAYLIPYGVTYLH